MKKKKNLFRERS